MHTRVVRFTGVTQERIDALTKRVQEAGGPPDGVVSSGIELLFDGSQGTAVVLQRFASASDMEASARVFEAMDVSDTPGTRASVDACEVKLQLSN
ncbi:MAG TPA: hypothetical protein VFW29_03940 [Solirubrobacteraceae bacterium]|nr:hypothetical protein [Solirubrobacteraceae bacterium]